MPFRKIVSQTPLPPGSQRCLQPGQIPHSTHAIRTRLQEKQLIRSHLRRLSCIPSDSVLPEDAKSFLKQFGKDPDFKKTLALVKKYRLKKSLPNHLIFAAITHHSPTPSSIPPATDQDKTILAPILESFASFYQSDGIATIPAAQKHVDTHQYSPSFQKIQAAILRVVNDPSGKWSHYNDPQLLKNVVCHIHQKYILRDSHSS